MAIFPFWKASSFQVQPLNDRISSLCNWAFVICDQVILIGAGRSCNFFFSTSGSSRINLCFNLKYGGEKGSTHSSCESYPGFILAPCGALLSFTPSDLSRGTKSAGVGDLTQRLSSVKLRKDLSVAKTTGQNPSYLFPGSWRYPRNMRLRSLSRPRAARFQR